MNEKIDISKLSPEQLAELTKQIREKEKAEKAAKLQMQNDYEQLKEVQVRETFGALQKLSANLEREKNDVFAQFGSLLKMKQELYGLSDAQMGDQQSHTFTSADGQVSIIIGSNVIDRWSDDINTGIMKINNWLDKLVFDENSKQMVAIIRDLLKPNKDGVLKANRVLELSKRANEIGDQELITAVDFIRDCYRPSKTSTYVKAKYLDENKQTQWLALSMSAV